MEPTRQVVRHTAAIGASGSPAVLAEMMTYLGYRWHPEYTVTEEYQDFNQEQYRVTVHLYSREYDSTTVLHTAYGVGVTIDMAVHDAAYAALTRLRGEYRELDTSPFRHIAIASDVGAEGYYTAAYSLSPESPSTIRTWFCMLMGWIELTELFAMSCTPPVSTFTML